MVGDLWERYLQLLDEGIPDGYACAATSRRRLTDIQRRDGPARLQAILLPANDHDAC